jgi:hypothetical protein
MNRPRHGRSHDNSRGIADCLSLWRTRFGSNPGLVGHKPSLNGYATTVIGVLPDLLAARVDPVVALKYEQLVRSLSLSLRAK